MPLKYFCLVWEFKWTDIPLGWIGFKWQVSSSCIHSQKYLFQNSFLNILKNFQSELSGCEKLNLTSFQISCVIKIIKCWYQKIFWSINTFNSIPLIYKLVKWDLKIRSGLPNITQFAGSRCWTKLQLSWCQSKTLFITFGYCP